MDTKEQLKDLILKLHNELGVVVEPTYPRILVRELPKEQIVGGIYLPDWQKHQQNKPASEGVVIKTYKPLFVPVSKVGRMEIDEMGNMAAVKRQFIDDDGKTLGYWLESKLQAGDHILYPHMEFGIVPVEPLDEGKGDYKMVPEGIIVSRLHYEQEKTKDWLEQWFRKNTYEDWPQEVADDLLQNADVIRKDVVAKTLSGR
jgi:hypothetical protein